MLIIEDKWIVADHIAGLAEDGGATSVLSQARNAKRWKLRVNDNLQSSYPM